MVSCGVLDACGGVSDAELMGSRSKEIMAASVKDETKELEAILESDESKELEESLSQKVPTPVVENEPMEAVQEETVDEARDEAEETTGQDPHFPPSETETVEPIEHVAAPTPEPQPVLLHQELDFDENPSPLYLFLQQQEWFEVVERLQSHPEEATNWISRKEVDGKMRWRLLPIHGAIIFHAPVHVVQALLEAHPGSISAKDDQGMLPLHLSYRMGSSKDVVELLIDTFPQSLEVKDRKGRTPITMTQTAEGPNREEFIDVIEKKRAESPSFPVTIPVLSKEAPVVPKDESKTLTLEIPKPKAMLEALAKALTPHKAVSDREVITHEVELEILRREHAAKIQEINAEANHAQKALTDKIFKLESELKESQKKSNCMLKHVELLEEKLQQEEETETVLATKIANLDINFQHTLKEKEVAHETLIRERDQLKADKTFLEDRLSQLQNGITAMEDMVVASKTKSDKHFQELEIKYDLQTKELEKAYEDYEGMCKNISILEEQLKKKIIHEQNLVRQISSLAKQLNSATQGSDESAGMFTDRVKALQKERDDLHATVATLTKKLVYVSEHLQKIESDQDEIITKAEINEKVMMERFAEHEKIATDLEEQQRVFESLRKESKVISDMITEQEDAFVKSQVQRDEVIQAMKAHGVHLGDESKRREDLVENVNDLKLQVERLLSSVAVHLPHDAKLREDDNLVDEVVQKCLGSTNLSLEHSDESGELLGMSIE